MVQYLRNGSKVFFDYAIAVLVFVIFIYPFMAITGDKFNSWLTVYSILFFLFAVYTIYMDMKELAAVEVRPQSEMKPYPWKGMVIGFVSIVPIILVTSVLLSVQFDNAINDRIRELVLNTLLGPLYFIVRGFRESVPGYFAAILPIPVFSTLGYLAGYYGIDIFRKVIRKKEPVQRKAFTKSPWNPTLNEKKKTSKKKKKKTNASGGQ